MNLLLNLIGGFKQNDLAAVVLYTEFQENQCKDLTSNFTVCLYVLIMSRTCFRVNECQGTPCSKQAQYLKLI